VIEQTDQFQKFDKTEQKYKFEKIKKSNLLSKNLLI